MDEKTELPHEPRFHFDSAEADEILSEWGDLARECIGSLRQFSRERPLETLAIAVLAGTVLGAWLGRRR